MAAGPLKETFHWKSDASLWLSEEFDDTFLVFFRPSGETHFLNFLSFGVLSKCSEQPHSKEKLASALRDLFDLSETELPESLIATVIEQLDETGLLTPVVQS